ncbi:hypothetical protein [Photobacterium arenosum]|uniref:hypothetical protein n=1 Tax=Photobacterium arenosum TaxID=2774143 RepID=UPI00288BBF27|nr:hypothetical protein [Photobacterium arenosum]
MDITHKIAPGLHRGKLKKVDIETSEDRMAFFERSVMERCTPERLLEMLHTAQRYSDEANRLHSQGIIESMQYLLGMSNVPPGGAK